MLMRIYCVCLSVVNKVQRWKGIQTSNLVYGFSRKSERVWRNGFCVHLKAIYPKLD